MNVLQERNQWTPYYRLCLHLQDVCRILALFFPKKIARTSSSRVLHSMSTFSTPQKSGSLARIRRLASSLANGKAYERRPDVEAEIQRVLRLHQSAWIAEAEDLQNENLVSLIRQIDRG